MEQVNERSLESLIVGRYERERQGNERASVDQRIDGFSTERMLTVSYTSASKQASKETSSSWLVTQ